MAYNKVILQGNLARDIELKYTSGGMAIATTAIAVAHKFTSNGEKKEETCYIDLTFFAKSAEIANQYLRKGSKCLVDGRLKLDQWNDKDGNKRSKHGIVVENFQMLDNKADSQQPQQQSQGATSGYGQQQTNTPPAQPQQQTIPQYDVDEDEIPF